jgi:site-specific recombinase XerD
LTDIATGWTECVPVLNRSPETVLAAIRHARQLFPFPLLGLDTDNGGEFLNAILRSYCQQEQITFTRSRPECSNDNAHVEQKNGSVVRKIVGHDRLVSVLAYQQLGELYQAARLLVNAFQPSMKLQSRHIEGEHERRIYDDAKTPWQRVLLSGVLPGEIEQKWCKDVAVLDPLRLVQHVETLQRAVWRCAEDGFGKTLLRFSLDACVSPVAHVLQREALNALAPVTPDVVARRDWSRSMDDPFLGEWEDIYASVRARPMASAGEILREWQRRFPERFLEAHLNILQRRLREMRASLLACQTESGGDQMDAAMASRASSEPPAREEISPVADASTLMLPDPVADTKELILTPEEGRLSVSFSLAPASEVSSMKDEGEKQDDPMAQRHPLTGSVKALLPATMTIDHAISLFLQGKHSHDWEPKTREWHETSLGQLQRYLGWRKVLLLSLLTASEIRGWLTFLRTEALITGTFRVQGTIATYARSAHAWCAWLVEQGDLEQSPFAGMPFPRGRKRHLRMIHQKTFERFLEACQASGTKRTTMAFATARNRAILWVLWDAGLLVSEVCALNLEDVDLAQGTLYVRGVSPRGRSLPLTPQVQQALTMYLEQYRLRAGKRGVSDPLFLSEQRARLTKNVFTQLFQRLCARAGLENRRLTPTMLREMFAIRFLQTEGPPQALRRLLGLAECTPIKRYLDGAGCARR